MRTLDDWTRPPYRPCVNSYGCSIRQKGHSGVNDDSSEVLDALPRGQAPDQVGANVQTDTPRPVTADAQPAAPRPFIEWVATRKIKGFCGTIDEAGDYYSEVYAGNASLSESITADYHGRFLIELIQNAYDVHPRDRSDGEIEVVLDIRAGAYGTLYVANRGAGFSTKDVNALCDMGLSSKPPGE